MHHSFNLGSHIPNASIASSMHPTFGEDFELDPAAPIRAIRSPQARESAAEEQQLSGSGGQVTTLQSVTEEEEKPEAVSAIETKQKSEEVVPGARDDQQAREETWGESFKIVWLATEKLPFNRTRHLRNPWNHEREVKVSRDGTELEPAVGQKLLDEWARLKDPGPETLGKVVGDTSAKGTASVPPSAKHRVGSAQG